VDRDSHTMSSIEERKVAEDVISKSKKSVPTKSRETEVDGGAEDPKQSTVKKRKLEKDHSSISEKSSSPEVASEEITEPEAAEEGAAKKTFKDLVRLHCIP